MSPWFSAAALDAVPPGGLLAVVVDGVRLLLCRTGEREVSAVEDQCTHDGAPLRDGRLTGSTLECARHGGRFDVRTGEALRMPAAVPLPRYPTRIRSDGAVEVELEDP